MSRKLNRLVVAVFACALAATHLRADEAEELPQLTVAAFAPGGRFQLVTLDVSGNVVEQIVEDPTNLIFPQWSPNGDRLAFVSVRTGHPQIHVLDIATQQRTELTTTSTIETHPCWSPDGKKLVFVSTRTGNYDVFVCDDDGSHPTNLTASSSFDSDPCWSPDGKRIAFPSNRAAGGGLGPFHIWTMDADGGNAKQAVVRPLTGWIYPSWSPDGAQLLFSDRTADGSWQVFVASLDGRSQEQITEGTGSNGYASWSPDERYIAYLHFEKPLDPYPGPGRLMLFDTETATHTAIGPDDLKCNGSEPAWKPR
ncbi:MAG TPA: hypothetical protein VFI31_21490 [Pirellulales bacterium]|nr:hypothetical protein [Pirellulales bacterium]